MISIRKYLDGVPPGKAVQESGKTPDLASAALCGYRAALQAMGRCGSDVCPALADGLRKSLTCAAEELSRAETCESIAAANQNVQERLQVWGQETAVHYHKKASEVRQMLLVMAHAAESVGERDQRCAKQINDVTAQLKRVADLEDLTQMRASIEKSAGELKTSIDRMTSEGEAALRQLRTQVSSYQARLEEAEQVASRDGLTHVRSRLWVEGEIEDRIDSRTPFCVAILDIDGFKRVNDEHGHLVGDELLKQFASELRAACRTSEVIGRWGGDEFIVLMDCRLVEARERIDRMSNWVCGNYTVAGNSGSIKVRVDVSMGVAEIRSVETMKQLVDRADADMYRHKAEARDKSKMPPR